MWSKRCFYNYLSTISSISGGRKDFRKRKSKRYLQHNQFSDQNLFSLLLTLSTILLSLMIVFVKCCNISEYECDNKECIQLDGYCNGVRQCRDGSDEKKGCSPCNRTYYGLETFTYKLSLHAPSLCTFTFIAAGGGKYGDIIQLSLPLVQPTSSFSSSFSTSTNPNSNSNTNNNMQLAFSSMTNNCTSILTMSEPNQISKFCLSTSFNSSKVNYYSNSNKITVSFSQNIEIVYKFLPSVMLTKGVLLQGTICSILYENCTKSSITSSSSILSTRNNNRFSTNNRYIMSSSSSLTSSSHGFISSSSSNDKLFAVSQSDSSLLGLGFNQANNNYYYPIHENNHNVHNSMNLNIISGSRSDNNYNLNNNDQCIVRSPNYPGIIASNVSCYYAFRESAGSLIHIQGSVRLGESEEKGDCQSYLVVYDGYSIRDRILGKYCGNMNVDVISGGNEMLVEFYSGKNGLWTPRGLQLEATSISSTLSTPCQTTISSLISMSGTLATPLSTLANSSSCVYNFQGTNKQLIWFMFQQFDGLDGGELIFTDGSKSTVYSNSSLPPLCELLYLPNPRPCKKESESILSKTNAVSISLGLPKPQFRIQYIFIEPSNCNKVFIATAGHLTSTRHLFDFGAGGTKQLRCSYEFNENTRIVIKDGSFEGSCKMIIDEKTSRTKCKYSSSKRAAQHTRLEYYQLVNQTAILKQCFCGSKHRFPIILTSNYKSKLLLVGVNMGNDISPDNSFFTGSFSKLSTPPCTTTHYLQVSTKSNFPFYSNCETFLLLLPKPSIYVQLEGCAIVHTDYDFNYLCWNEIFSPGFKNSTLSNNIYIELTNALTINYVQVFNPLEPNYNYVHGDPYGLAGAEEELIDDTCGGFKCTSINACIHKELFCNGNTNCPNGEDEACSMIDYTYLYLFIGVVLGLGTIILICTGIKRTKIIRKGIG